jgi:hypothetical protein
VLHAVEPDALAGLATVHRDIRKLDGFHRGVALGTVQRHGKAPEFRG